MKAEHEGPTGRPTESVEPSPSHEEAPGGLEADLARLRDSTVPLVSNMVTPNRPLLFDDESCTKCNLCIEACPMDVLVPNPVEKGIPLIMFPDECWYCGCCEMHCPWYADGAIRMNFPVMQRVRWKRKDSGEHFRVGMKNPPPPNTREPA